MQTIVRVREPVTREGTVSKYKNRDVTLITGRDGSKFIAGEDKMGRMYMYDSQGNLYYDSGVEGVGWYAVS